MYKKKHLAIFLVIIISVFSLTGCGGKETGYQDIDAEKAQEMIVANKDIILLDVREEYEFAAGHIPNSILMPLGTVSSSIDKLEKNQEIIIICAVGSRSPVAAEYLVEQGFTKVYNLSGGLNAWPYDIVK